MNSFKQAKHLIFTGTPGSGKTSVIIELEKLGHTVIHEAATDVISQEQAKGLEKPWEEPVLLDEIDRCLKNVVYQNKIFFFENLGFIEHTDARKISYEDALIFEQIHLDVYKEFGFDIVMVPKGLTVQERCEFILERAIC